MELEHLINGIIDYRGKTPLKLGMDWDPNGEFLALSARNIKTGHLINLDSCYHGTKLLYDAWMKDEVERNDILITSEAPFGEVFIWESDKKFILSQRLYCIKPNPNKIIPKFLYYSICSNYFQDELKARATGSTATGLRQPELLACDVKVPEVKQQQHIVNTIGSIDDLLENLTKQNDCLFRIGVLKINKYNNCMLQCLSDIVTFEKGFEVGSSSYSDIKQNNMINYIRVGDLQNLGSTYVELSDRITKSNYDDILCAFDGAPGRNNIGLVGAYSSGIYNLKCANHNKGLVFFEINSDLNQKIINDYSQGTTILHAAKSISHLQYALVTQEEKDYLNNLFNLILQNKKKIDILSRLKANLLARYF